MARLEKYGAILARFLELRQLCIANMARFELSSLISDVPLLEPERAFWWRENELDADGSYTDKRI